MNSLNSNDLRGPNPSFEETERHPQFNTTDSIRFTGPSPAGICPGGRITLTAGHAPAGSTFQWTLNGSPIAGATDSVYQANATGDYSVVVVNGMNTFQWPTLNVTAFTLPVPSFTFAPNNTCSSTPIGFTNTTPGTGNTYSWNFGDPNSGTNNTSSDADPVHHFIGSPVGGNQSFTVKLYVTNSNGCIDSTTRVINTQSPSTALSGTGLVVFNGNPVFTSCAASGATLTINNQSTTAATNQNYTIDFGNGNPPFTGTTFTTIQQTYAPGSYTLSFIVTGANGCQDTGFYQVFIGSNPAVGLTNPGNTVTCSDNSLSFPITSTSGNSPGTVYTVTFNDGSAPRVFNHPAPASVSHVFASSSCGILSQSGSNIFPNSFSATIRATNPCGTSSASVVPIYVSRRPRAAITISPRDTVCVNTAVQISNATGNFQSVVNGACVAGRVVWTITPNTGFTFTGFRGATNNSSDPNAWTAGTGTITLNFTQPGVYSVKMLVGNSAICPLDSVVRTICVSPTAVSSFTLSETQGCGPLQISSTNNSPSGNCGLNTFLWTVTHTNPNNCGPATGDWNFTNGSAASSMQPSFSFNSPGVYSVRLQTTSAAGACNATSTQTVTVRGRPAITFNEPSPICPGPFSPVATVNNCYSNTTPTYLWTFTGGVPAAATTLNPTVNYPALGNYSVQFSATNDCGTSSVTQNLTVTLTPSVDQPSNVVVCNRATVPATVFTSPNPGMSFTWTNSDPAIGLPASGSGDIASFQAVNTGSTPRVATITVTPSNGTCVGPSRTFTITVNPTPPINGGPDQVTCALSTLNLNATLAPGTTGTWTQLSGPATTITNPNAASTTVTGVVIGGAYQYVWTVTGAGICPLVQDTVRIVNRPLPVAANAGADTVICDFNDPTLLSFNLRGNTIPNAWDRGTWTVVSNTTGANVTFANANQPTTLISGVGLSAGNNQGSLTLRWSITSDGGCTPTTSERVIQVVRRPVAGAVGPLNTICYGGDVTLTATGFSGVIDKWQRKDAPTATNPFNDITNNTPTLALTNVLDTVQIRFIVGSVNPACPNRDTATVTVPVQPRIINTIAGGVDSVCAGVPYTVTQTPASGGNGTAAAYQWQSSTDGITYADIATQNGPAYSFTPMSTVWLRRLATIGGCTVSSDTLQVAVEPVITNNIIGPNDSVCLGSNAPLIPGSLPSGGTGNFIYQWEFSTNGTTWTAIIGANGQNYTPGALNVTTYYRRRVSTPRCPDPIGAVSNIDTIIAILPPIASFAPSRVTGCSPMAVTFTNNSTGSNNVYRWNFDDGSPELVTTSSAPINRVFTSGVPRSYNVRLIVESPCGRDTMNLDLSITPNSASLNLTVAASELSGCAPHTVTFYNSSPGATGFEWNFNDGTPLVNTTNPIDTLRHTFTTGGTYNVTLRGTNSCSDTTGNVTITVRPRPTAAFTLAQPTYCVGATVGLTNTSTNATSYLWRFSDGTTSSLQTPSKSFSTPGTYTVRLIAYNGTGATACADSVQQDVVVSATQTGSMTVTPPSSSCAPYTVTLTNNTTPATSVSWDLGDNSGIRTTNSVTHTYTQAGNYTVTLTVTTAGGCTYTTTQTIVVSGPRGQLLYTGGYKCPGQSVRFEAIATGANSYTWDFGNGVTQTTTGPVVVYDYPNPGNYLPSVILNSPGCNFEVRGTDSVRIERITNGFQVVAQNFCDSTRLTFIDTSTVFFGRTFVNWNFGNGMTATGSPARITITNDQTLNVTQVVGSNSGCTDTLRRQVNVLVWNTPVVQIVPPAGNVACSRDQVTFDAVINAADPVTNLQWSTSNGITGTTTPFRPTFANPGTYTIQLVVSTANGCTATSTSTLTVNQKPTVSFIQDTVRICEGNSVVLAANSTGATVFSWTPSNNLSCNNCPNPTANPRASTNYTITADNGTGCTATASVFVQVTPQLQPTVLPMSDSICLGDSLQMLASGGDNYLWTGPNLSCTTCPNPVITPTASAIYTVTISNSCFTQTTDIPIGVGNQPEINLGPDLVLPAGTVRQLAPTVSNGPITTWIWSPATNLSCANCPAPTLTARSTTTYTVIAMNSFGCWSSDTITVRTFCESAQVYVPNAFSPDGDGINDVLMVRGSGIAQVKSFRVFNRWGEIVYERANFPANDPAYGWDGKVKGTVSPPDVFVYTAEVVCENGTTYTYKGNVSVLK